MYKLELEYIFHTTPGLIFEQLTTPSGLSGWFAQDVDVRGEVYVFKWNDYKMEAKMSVDNKEYKVRFQWLDEPDKYTEIRLKYNRLTKDTDMLITDMADSEEDAADLKTLWDGMIKRLKSRLGLPPVIR